MLTWSLFFRFEFWMKFARASRFFLTTQLPFHTYYTILSVKSRLTFLSLKLEFLNGQRSWGKFLDGWYTSIWLMDSTKNLTFFKLFDLRNHSFIIYWVAWTFFSRFLLISMEEIICGCAAPKNEEKFRSYIERGSWMKLLEFFGFWILIRKT